LEGHGFSRRWRDRQIAREDLWRPEWQNGVRYTVFMPELDIEIKKYRRSRRLRVLVKPGGRVVVTTPLRTPKYLIDRFIEKNAAWIQEARVKMLKAPVISKKGSAEEYKKYKKQALEIFSKRLVELNQHYNFIYKRVSIRNQSSRWGSCSRSGTLSFSYRLLFLPEEVRDYVLVHELCHLQHMNHSKKFWSLVAEVCPNHKLLRKQLKN
jgi:predicted metal-dependent hydrolase